MKPYSEIAMEHVLNAFVPNFKYIKMIELTGLYPYRDVFYWYLITIIDYRNRDKDRYDKSKVDALRKVLSPIYTEKFENLVNKARDYGDIYLSGNYDTEEYGIIKYNTLDRFLRENGKLYSEIHDFLTGVDHKENRKTFFEEYYKNDI